MTSNLPACPCCGGAVSPLDFLLDPASRTIAYNGASARLTPIEYAFTHALLNAFPRVLSRVDLMDILYRNPNDAPDTKIIDVFACKIRRKLDPLGIVVLTTWGIGYSLDLTTDDKAALARSKAFERSRSNRHHSDAPDITLIKVYREQGYPLTDIARRMGLTLKAVMVAVDSLDEQREAQAA